MSRRRRRRGRSNDGGAGQRSQRRKRASDRSQKDQQQDAAAFWGDPAELPPVEMEVRITEDPTAVPRSLGEPPLPGHREISEHYFAAIYDRAVHVAGALAAAGGLIQPDDLTSETDDE